MSTEKLFACAHGSDQDSRRGAVLLGDRAHGTLHHRGGHDHALLGRQVLPAQAVDAAAGET